MVNPLWILYEDTVHFAFSEHAEPERSNLVNWSRLILLILKSNTKGQVSNWASKQYNVSSMFCLMPNLVPWCIVTRGVTDFLAVDFGVTRLKWKYQDIVCLITLAYIKFGTLILCWGWWGVVEGGRWSQGLVHSNLLFQIYANFSLADFEEVFYENTVNHYS
jgi:hypothetical protein